MNSTSLHPNRTSPRLVTAAAPTARWLALGAAFGPILFTLAWIVLGVLQPPVATDYGVMGGLSGAISNPISGLGVGPYATLFNLVGFGVSAVITLAGVIGVFQALPGSGRGRGLRRAGAVLLALSPVGMLLAGVFTLKSSVGLHLLAALVAFVAAIAGFVVTGLYLRRLPGWRTFGNWLVVAGPVSLALMVLYFLTFNIPTVAAGQGVAGLTERIFILEVHAWYVALGWLAFRRA